MPRKKNGMKNRHLNFTKNSSSSITPPKKASQISTKPKKYIQRVKLEDNLGPFWKIMETTKEERSKLKKLPKIYQLKEQIKKEQSKKLKKTIAPNVIIETKYFFSQLESLLKCEKYDSR